MSGKLIVVFTLMIFVGLGCQPSEQASENPPAESRSEKDLATDTLNQMLAVAKKGDWETYVDQYYGEQHKFKSEADRDALVKRFSEQWGEKIVPGLERAAKQSVQIDGDKALFVDGEETVFVLHRSEDGSWKFHL